MKLPFRLQLAFGFVGVLLLIVAGIWTYSLFSDTNTSTATAPSERGIFGSLFPFGRSGTVGEAQPQTGDLSDGFTGPVPRLRQVTRERVSGMTFVFGVSRTQSLRYVERETGHIYETPVDSLTSVRLTNTTIPAVHDATWINSSTTLMRFLDRTGSFVTFVGVLATTSLDQTLTGAYLKPYGRVSVSGARVLGVLDSGTTLFELTSATSTKTTPIYSGPIRSWIPILSGARAYVASAPSGTAGGNLYAVTAGELVPIATGVIGLEVLPKPGAQTFIATQGGVNTLELFVITESGSRLQIPLRTLVHKCTWVGGSDDVVCAIPKSLPNGVYPDDWNLGRIHTEDSLWKIDTQTLTTTLLMDLGAESQGTAPDIGEIVADENGAHVAYINRTDGTLWVATVTQSP